MRGWPVAAYWVVIVVDFASAIFGLLSPAQLIVPMVAAYVVARYGPRRQLWLTAIPVVPFVVLWLANDGPAWDAAMLVGIYGSCLLLGVTVADRRSYRQAKEELARASERNRIARELHDIVAHNLAVMVALADGAVASAATPERSTDLMAKVSTTGRQALSEVRQLVGLLREDSRSADLDGLVDQVRAAGLHVTLTRTGDAPRLGPGVELTIYRIVQEALTNTMKHAGPDATATVRVHYDVAAVEVEVVDDGAGRAAEESASGHGLTGIRERVAAYGGSVDAGPRADGGWRVNARLTVPS
ncbi:sensor histidine kinase [Tenggerimyces flavus]|uniref:histidine kinase n=1 Tax=Tenggerimyces flavus TaxID=1708749 RepID=A0ABV7YI18_9ACTN|nr:histidine kinase [Tenggerimyces flavus]MBM7789938.1 signal transduction histidine kinase [Tenggerimyces flavus]